MFRAANGAAVQTQGGGYTAAVQRAIAQGDKAGLMELAKPANYGSALRTPDAQQALSLARRNLGSGKKAQVSTAPSVDVADVEQISMGNLPTKAAPVYSLPMFGSLQTGQQGPSSPRVSDESLGIPAMVSETSQPPAAPSTGTNTTIQSILQTLFPKLGAQAAETPAPAPAPAPDSGLAALKPRTTTPAFPMLAAAASGTLEDTVMQRVLNGPIDLGMPASVESTAQKVSEETDTPTGDTTDTQAGAANDAESAAKEEGAKLSPIQTAFGDLDVSISETYKPSELVTTLEDDLNRLTRKRENLSEEERKKVAAAEGRVNNATAALDAALNERRTKAKEITMDDVKAEALKIAGVDQGKYDKDRENAIWMNMIKSGLAIAAGESENAITNIAKGLSIGVEGYGQDLASINQQEREDRKELRNVQLMLVKNKQDLENAWTLQQNSHKDTILQLRAAEKQGADSALIAAQAQQANTNLSLSQLETTTALEINKAKVAERKMNADRAFQVWSTKMATVPDEVWETIALGGEYAVKDPETGQWSWTEKGEQTYKDAITASTKSGYKITDLMNTATRRAASGNLNGFDLTKRADGTEISEGDRVAIALAWEKDDVIAQADKAAKEAMDATRKSSEKQAAANAARKAYIDNWMSNYQLVPIVPNQQQQQGAATSQAAAPAPAQGAAPGTTQQPIVLK